MKPRKHADIIKAWADGAEIQVLGREKYRNPEWLDVQPPEWDETSEYRIKPTPAPWYENIPPQGVLCWVSDKHKDREGIKSEKVIEAVTEWHKGSHYEFQGRDERWTYAFPLTKEEAAELVYQGGEE